jgi:hypothetical protein
VIFADEIVRDLILAGILLWVVAPLACALVSLACAAAGAP